MLEALKSLWWLLINVGYLVLILLASWLLFTVPAQADDFVYVFVQDVEISYIILVAVFLGLWCYVTWYSACIILQIDPIETLNDVSAQKRLVLSSHQRLTLEIPRILGIVPCLILASAIWFVPDGTHDHQYFYLIGLLFIGVFMYRLFVYQDRNASRPDTINHLQSNKFKPIYDLKPGRAALGDLIQKAKSPTQYRWPTNQEVAEFHNMHGPGTIPTIKEEILFILQYASVRFYYLFFGAWSVILLVVFSVPTLNLWVATAIHPASVLIVSVTFITFVSTIISFFHDYTSRPFAIVIVLWIVFWSGFNDNTRPPYEKELAHDPRLPVGQAFDAWLKERKEQWPDSTPMPVIFIATQGGGTRGLNWTTRVLDTLSKIYPEQRRNPKDPIEKNGFYRQTFAISGVSGGGVGATFYSAYRRNSNINTKTDKQLKDFTKSDFLSPVTASFAFGDSFQKLLPWPVPALERSKILGQTWDWQYSSYMDKSMIKLDQSFLDMWYAVGKINLDHPSLFINGTLAENGQRVVTSNLSLEGDWFKEEIDFFTLNGHDISISTAALNCCRFPFITSGALLEGKGCKKGHIIDGGYRENTGLQTISNLYYTVKDRFDHDPSIFPLFIYLKNGTDELNDQVKAIGFFHDLATPLMGVVGVNGTAMPAKGIQQFFLQSFGEQHFFVMDLENRDSDHIKLPLGWYMSDVVSEEIDKRVCAMERFDSLLIKRLDAVFGRTLMNQ
jgi:hypothetical protein